MAADSFGNLYIADSANQRVRKVSSSGIITTVAGTGGIGSSGVGGAAVQTQLTGPSGIAVDSAGNLYILDGTPGRVLKVDGNGILTQIAGGDAFGNTPRGRQTFFQNALAVDRAGTVYFTDTNQYRVRSISPGGLVTTIAGNSTSGYSGDGGLATDAQFLDPAGIAVDPGGRVYIADSGNNAIRMLQPLPPSIGILSVTNGASGGAGPVAPGEIVVIYGAQLGPDPLNVNAGGTTVAFNNVPADIVYSSATQVCAVVPVTLTGAGADVSVTYQGQTAHASVMTATSAPGLFTLDVSGVNQALAFNEDGSINTPGNPAAPGSVVSLYGTGLGAATTRARVEVGGTASLQTAVGNVAAFSIPGVSEIKVSIPPQTVGGGAVPVVIRVDAGSSQSGLGVSISK